MDTSELYQVILMQDFNAIKGISVSDSCTNHLLTYEATSENTVRVTQEWGRPPGKNGTIRYS